MVAGLADLELLTDADDGNEVVLEGGSRFRGDQGVVFVVVGAALRMSDDGVGAAQLGQEGTADLAGVGPRLVLGHVPAPYVRRSLSPSTEVWKNTFLEGFGPELSAGRALADLHPHSRIAIVKFAWNATSLYWDWDPNRTHSKYEAMVSGTRHAIAKLAAKVKAPVRIAGFFWMQGESDANTYDRATSYGASLKEFIASVRADFRSPKLPFVIGQIDDVRKYHPVLLPYSRSVRAEQARVRTCRPPRVPREDGRARACTASPVHFSTQGTIDLGRRFVNRTFGL